MKFISTAVDFGEHSAKLPTVHHMKQFLISLNPVHRVVGLATEPAKQSIKRGRRLFGDLCSGARGARHERALGRASSSKRKERRGLIQRSLLQPPLYAYGQRGGFRA